MDAKGIIQLLDEMSAANLVKMYKKHGKAAVMKFQKLKTRVADKKKKSVKFVDGKPVIVTRSSKQVIAGKKSGKKLKRGVVQKKKKKSANVRKSVRANKIANRLGLK
jgi:hypothetical protein